MPKSRLEFWKPKLEGNRARDERQLGDLEAAGWTVKTIWECEVRDQIRLGAIADAIRQARPNRSA
jgi:DNA mismatch endonuclease, patch repair protein